MRMGGGLGLLSLLPVLIRSPLGWLVLLAIGGFYVVRAFMGGGGSAQPVHNGQAPATHAGDEVHFAGFVLDDVQNAWTEKLAARGVQYRHAKLVLFTDATNTACGTGETATGPFYCPGDEKVYVDLGFFRELSTRFGAKGDFAQAYVLAHEIGHHVQNLNGTEARVRRVQGANPESANAMSVRLELQADCYAGVWGHHAAEPGRAAQGKVELDPGDADEALHAAAAIGDDRLQRLGTGRVMPEKFTHGSSQQRVTWFKRGFDSGDPGACDTFK